MPTTNPVPSTDPGDLLYNAQKLDEVVSGSADSYTDRLGVSRLTLTGAMRLLGYEAPVAFASGLTITRASQTVTNGGNTYHANPASLPFTTTATFNASQWRVINNITYADMTGYAIPKAGATDLVGDFKTTGTWTGQHALPIVNAYWSWNSVSNSVIYNADANDFMQYSRPLDAWAWFVAGENRLYVDQYGPGRNDDASTANGLVRKSQLDAAAPPGAVTAFAMSSAPTGWLKANGAAVSRSTYAALFAAIGTTFGAGDGSTTFNLPDLRGEFVRGWDDGRSVDGGRVLGSAQAQDLQSHTHTVAIDGGGVNYNGTGTNQVAQRNPAADYPVKAAGGAETRPRNVALLYCIKF